ncbi:facilitated trehalose transporter Tret1-2 homolog [Euwallacea fornicatus]|uniref:facilitated trehalose transporter Tret1-2 homolog n=1 Tax=Euwallacea fornicatus TaxID=995702 RepID=UPI00338DD4D9
MTRVDAFSVIRSAFKERRTDDPNGLHPVEVFPPYLRQSVAALGPLLLTIVVGMTLGYSAVLLPQLQEASNMPQLIRINKEEASWVASLAVIPMAVGTLIGGLFIQKYGRKKTQIIVCVPYFLGWILMYFAINLEMLLTGRFLTGLCSGVLGPATVVYIGETSDPKYRGVFLGGIPLCVSIGLLHSHLLGTFLTWQTAALVISMFPLVSWLLMIFTPESPAWLAQKGLTKNAQRSFFWLRGSSEEAKHELEQILARQKETQQREQQHGCETGLKKWFKDVSAPEFWKPVLILLVFFITSQWAGVNAVSFYSVSFMKNILGDALNEYLATFIIDCVRLVGSVVACILLKKIGRRQLALIGGILTFLPLFILSAFIYVTRELHIEITTPTLAAVPITCLLTYTFFVTTGFVTLPWNLMGELLPMSKKSLGSGVASFVAYISMFSVVKTMPAMVERLGTDGTFAIYGSMTLFGTVFVYMFLPETRGKTLHEIEDYFKSGKDDVLDVRL